MKIKRLRLIKDALIGVLLRIGLGLDKPTTEGIRKLFYNGAIDNAERLELALLQKDGLLSSATTWSHSAKLNIKSHIEALEQKLSAVSIIDTSIATFKYTNKEIAELENILKVFSKYKYYEKISYDDYLSFAKTCPNFIYSLSFEIFIARNQIKKIKAFIKKYFKQYYVRDLEGQEDWGLAYIYAKPIENKLNRMVNVAGYKRLKVNNYGDRFFCHSIKFLLDNNKIKLQDLRPMNGQWEAIIDLIPPEIQGDIVKKFDWPKSPTIEESSLVFDEKNKVSFKSIKSGRFKIFEYMFNNKGNLIKEEELEKQGFATDTKRTLLQIKQEALGKEGCRNVSLESDIKEGKKYWRISYNPPK